MNITRFFTDVLGAKLRTPYRWGAINEYDQFIQTCSYVLG